MSYNAIRVAAYRPDRAIDFGPLECRSLAFPAPVREILDELYNLDRDGQRRRDRLPTRSLDNVFHAWAPDLLSVARTTAVGDGAPWLYSRGEFDVQLVKALIKHWVHTLRPEPEYRKQFRAVLRQLDDISFDWATESVDVLARTVTPGGTAQPVGRLFQLLPDVLAGRVLARGPLRHDGLRLTFRQSVRDKGAELVSWPPRKVTGGYSSAVITITVQTVPFSDDFRVHVRTGIRRWVSGHTDKLPYRRSTTVQLLADTSWIAGGPEVTRLATGHLVYDAQQRRPAWAHNGPEELLRALRSSRTFPDPSDLWSDPDKWLDGRDGVQAGIIHSNRLGTHELGAGLMAIDRIPLIEWVEEAFSPELVRVPDLVRPEIAHRPVSTKPRGLPEGTPEDVRRAHDLRIKAAAQQAFRRGLPAAIGDRTLRLEILWQNRSTRDELIRHLVELLGLRTEGDLSSEFLAWKMQNFDVELRTRPLDDLSGPLVVRRNDGRLTTRLGDAIGVRRQEVRSFLAGGRPAHLAVVELKQTFSPAHTDPKFALRLGCADAGRVSQFISTSEEALGQRVKSVWLDGFRQLGHRACPTHTLDERDVPPELQYVGVWLVKRRADGPTRRSHRTLVAVRLRRDGDTVSIDGWHAAQTRWLPYREFLLDLSKHAEVPSAEPQHDEIVNVAAWPRLAEQRAQFAHSFGTLLFQLRDRPTMLMVHAQNARTHLPYLANTTVVADRLRVGAEPMQQLAVFGRGLRLVRVRTADQDETPQWHGVGGVHGHSAGLWADPDADADNRVFYSTVDKPVQAKHAKTTLARYFPGDRGVLDHEPNAWNPRLLELAVLGMTDEADKAVTWAALAHQLRQVPDSSGALALPVPLHLAKQATEYVLPNDQPVPDSDAEADELAAAEPEDVADIAGPAEEQIGLQSE